MHDIDPSVLFGFLIAVTAYAAYMLGFIRGRLATIDEIDPPGDDGEYVSAEVIEFVPTTTAEDIRHTKLRIVK